MGIDLTLVIDKHGLDNRMGILAYSRLYLDRNYELFEVIKALEPVKLDGCAVKWYGDEGLKGRRDDQYGDPLTYLRAHRFKSLVKELRASATSKWNDAVLTMIAALDPDTRIVLWWH